MTIDGNQLSAILDYLAQGKGSDNLGVSRIQNKETLGVGITLNWIHDSIYLCKDKNIRV